MSRATRISHLQMAHTETVAASVQPEPHQLPNSLSHFGILPIQVRLLCDKKVQVIFVCGFVIFPGRAYTTKCLFMAVKSQK